MIHFFCKKNLERLHDGTLLSFPRPAGFGRLEDSGSEGDKNERGRTCGKRNRNKCIS